MKVNKKEKEEVKGYGRECDIWSTGVLLYALIYGVMPYRGATVREIKEKILNVKYQVMYKTMDKDPVSPECQDLIEQMMARDPKKRPTVDEVLNNEWFNDALHQEKNVFDENERVKMIKEYLLAENS